MYPVIEYFLYWLGQKITYVLPKRNAYAIAKIIARIHYMCSAQDRKIVQKNLCIIYDKATPDIQVRKSAQKVIENFALYLVDFFYAKQLTKEYIQKYISLKGADHLDHALEKGKGGILLSAHFGNWEWGGLYLSLLGYPICAVARSHKDKKVDAFFVNQRKQKGLEVIPLEDCIQYAFRWLRKNKFFAILGDRSFSADTIAVRIFNKKAFFPKGPAILALRTGAPLIPGFFMRVSRTHYEMIMEEPLVFPKTGDLATDVQILTQKYAEILEKYILQYPEQWFIFHQFWSE